jgi:hypothetical protein
MKKSNILLVALVFTVSILTTGCGNQEVTTTTTGNNTTVEESRYNDMSPSDYYKEMKSDNLAYSDIAWHAYRTYGWDCSEVTNLGEKINTSGKELRDPLLISELKGYYQVATCSSGIQLRVYARKDTYPIITNIDGGFE